MMTFKIEKNAHIATNSIKPVNIVQLDEYGKSFDLNMPDGDLYTDTPILHLWFDSFEKARKRAEAKVGVSITLGVKI